MLFARGSFRFYFGIVYIFCDLLTPVVILGDFALIWRIRFQFFLIEEVFLPVFCGLITALIFFPSLLAIVYFIV